MALGSCLACETEIPPEEREKLCPPSLSRTCCLLWDGSSFSEACQLHSPQQLLSLCRFSELGVGMLLPSITI